MSSSKRLLVKPKQHIKIYEFSLDVFLSAWFNPALFAFVASAFNDDYLMWQNNYHLVR